MASENITVIKVVNDMRQRAAVALRQDADAMIHHHAVGDMLAYLANQVEVAHKREMEYRALIAGVSLADAVDEAHKRELAAKDDERLTIVANYENIIAAKDRVIAGLREKMGDDDLLKMARDIEAKDAEIAKLRTLTTRTDNSEVIAELERKYADACKCCDNAERRLKVAEDALDFAWMYADKLPHQWPLPERVRTKMRNALAAIRGEGGAK